jgi:succinoglycan biosynthesis protein ExoL
MDGSSAEIATSAIEFPIAEIGASIVDGIPPPWRNKNLAFFAPDISDATTIKRMHQFLSRGFTVTVLGFRRDRYNVDFKPPWPHVLLGYTEDLRYLRRITALFAALAPLWRERDFLSRAAVLYARNLDQLLLALIVRACLNRRATVVYEVLDVQPVLARRGPLSVLLRLVERLSMRFVRYLVLSSPGFYRHYYAPVQKWTGPWVLLENKLSGPAAATPRSRTSRRPSCRSDKWVIGYFGLIRGQATIDLMFRVARRLPDRVVFRFQGVFTTVAEAQFRAALEQHPNITFGGSFRSPEDLAELYGGVDFAWAIDLENADSNSRWLLPCRLYEAGYFGVPCLAARGFELGHRVERHGIGWTFEAPFEDDLVRFFATVTPAEYERKRRALAALPDGAFVAGADLDALSRVLTDPDWALADRATPALAGPRAA